MVSFEVLRPCEALRLAFTPPNTSR